MGKPETLENDSSWRTQNSGRVLAMATAMFESEVLRVLQGGEFGWVNRVYLALFRNLDLEGTRLTEIAARASITKQSAQELVDKAEAYGVVERLPAPDDRRAKIIMFTPAGLRMLEMLHQGVADTEQRLALAMGPTLLRDMKAGLRAYIASAGEATPSRAIPATPLDLVEQPAAKKRARR